MALKTYHRGIRDMKVATWTSANVYGTAMDVLGARNMSVEWVVETDELRGDDVVLDRFTKVVAVTVRIEMASVDLELLDVITGGTYVTNAAYDDLKITEADDAPYFAVAGRVVSSTQGDLQIFVPKCKLAGNLQLSAQTDTYMIPQAEFQGVNEGTVNGIVRFRNFAVAAGLEIPLRTTAGGTI